MEKNGENKGNWRVMRQDTHGVEYDMPSHVNLSKEFAEVEAQKYNDKGHHQFYWAEEMPAKAPSPT